LTIAELERFRDDPFWMKKFLFRTVLFVAFWLLWIFFFLASILIVVMSPKCIKEKPIWWHNAVTYNIWTPSFQDSDGDGQGDLQGISDRLEDLRRLGIEAIWPEPFLLSDQFDDAIRDFKAVDSKIGLNDDGIDLIEKTHSKGMKFILTLPIAITSNEHDWFLRSSRASLTEFRNFSGYYHWRNSTNIDHAYFSSYKNTTVYYMHYKNNPKWPVLNWQYSAFRNDMFDVLSHWIDKGVDGFHLKGLEYLYRISNGSSPYWSGIGDILRDIRNHIEIHVNQSEQLRGKKIILFARRDSAKENDKIEMVENGLDSMVNYELTKIELHNNVCTTSIVDCSNEIISDVLQFHAINKKVPPMWEFGNPYISRLASRIKSRNQAELLTMIHLLLPGTNNFYYGEEIGMTNLPDNFVAVQRGAMQWDNTKNAGFSESGLPAIPVHPNYATINFALQKGEHRSQLKMFQCLARLRRRDETLSKGHSYIVRNGLNSLIFTRYRTNENKTIGNIFVAIANFDSTAADIQINDIEKLKEIDLSNGEIVTFSSGVESFYIRQLVDLSSGQMHLGAEQGVVIKFTA
uniref:alpha-glucosidase n=1 Tax=Dracunculus medinensis TaxID=318479 RepID=A0A0N4UR44_DRAME